MLQGVCVRVAMAPATLVDNHNALAGLKKGFSRFNVQAGPAGESWKNQQSAVASSQATDSGAGGYGPSARPLSRCFSWHLVFIS